MDGGGVLACIASSERIQSEEVNLFQLCTLGKPLGNLHSPATNRLER